jgi:putative ABC transport system ATP-binding protein
MTDNTPMIELTGIDKEYEVETGRLAVLRDINLTVERGEFVAISGASGSGKSTLLNIVGCLDRQSDGRYVLAGHDVSRLGDTELSRIRNEEIGFVFQSFNLVPSLSALENVLLPTIYSKKPSPGIDDRARDLLSRVGLGDRIGHTPARLSGGQQQRVAIARALINEPSVIVADEPTGNLDSQSSGEIMDIFSLLHRQGATIVLVTHDEAISARASRVIHIVDGSIEQRQEMAS